MANENFSAFRETTANQNDARCNREKKGIRRERKKKERKGQKRKTGNTHASALRNPDGCQTTLIMAHAKEREEENMGNERRETGYGKREMGDGKGN